MSGRRLGWSESLMWIRSTDESISSSRFSSVIRTNSKKWTMKMRRRKKSQTSNVLAAEKESG